MSRSGPSTGAVSSPEQTIPDHVKKNPNQVEHRNSTSGAESPLLMLYHDFSMVPDYDQMKMNVAFGLIVQSVLLYHLYSFAHAAVGSSLLTRKSWPQGVAIGAVLHRCQRTVPYTDGIGEAPYSSWVLGNVGCKVGLF